MSWKFGGIYFKKDYSPDVNALLNALGYKSVAKGAYLSMEEVTKSTFEDSAIGFVNNSTLLHDNLLPYRCSFEEGEWYPMDDVLTRLSATTDVFCFLLDGITSTYGMSYFQNGKRIRCRGVFGNNVTFNEGRLLPGETEEQNQDEEERIFCIMEIFTGTSFSTLLEKDFQLQRFKLTSNKT